MLKKVSSRTAKRIKEKMIDTGLVSLPIDAEAIDVIFEWFWNEEISLANAKADGESVDEKYVTEICRAVDELLETEEDQVDLDHLNGILAKQGTSVEKIKSSK